MTWIVSSCIGLPHFTYFETIVELFRDDFNQNEFLEVCFGSLVGACDSPLLSIHLRWNFRLINSENENASRRHLDVKSWR